MLLDNKKWLNSKGFSDTDIDSIIKHCQNYPAGEKTYNEQLRRLRTAKKHFQDGLTQIKAVANSFPIIMSDIDVIYTQLANGNNQNNLRVNAPLILNDTKNDELQSLIVKLEQVIQSISIAATPPKSALIGNCTEPPIELKLTTGKGQLINQLHNVWLQKDNKITISDTSDFVTFLAIVFDDNMENASKWKSAFDRICLNKFPKLE
ncbi:hypothetical protein [Shewanella sp. S1-58-MNA-CIBAN-0166]|uniref:hypothetical protein n=1 Tax=Shewanella sp. S1-58-MNA-CIBAN-0166 TaxID=3140467 RepID=UPI00332AD345